MRDPAAMVAFYSALGLKVNETPHLVQVYVGEQMINFHRPSVWERGFELRAPAAVPPCGDLCFVWEGTASELAAALDAAGAAVVEGPVERDGGRQSTGTSVYMRDPDGNLLEFLAYPDGEGHGG
jgi:catechol 2,3-dioxygenase-like lactoylglutathione lyase family enzyme